ncbi:unnamed protein product, partial [Musa banksii]
EVHRGGSSWEISIRVWIVGAWGFNLINYVIWIVDCSNLDGESREVPLCNIYLCFVDKSFWSFRSYSSARPIVRAGMEGINEHASDDSWCDDGLLNEISDADLNREQKRRYDQFYT